MIAVGSTLFAVFVFLFVITIVQTNKNRQKVKHSWLFMNYPVACAGVPSADSRVFMRAPSIENNEFKTKTGKLLDPSLYYQYVVEGNSMKFCGIETGSLIFVKKGFTLSDIDRFPVVLVIKRIDAFGNQPQFKIRRAWRICKIENDTDFKSIIHEIITSSSFKDIKEVFEKEGVYSGDDNLIIDFMENRLPYYLRKYIHCESPKDSDKEFVISTTYDTVSQKIHFSMHPVTSIIGIVSESFILPNEQKNK